MVDTNRRAAVALALQSFDGLRDAQQRAILDCLGHYDGTWPRIPVSTRASTRRALEQAELVEPGSRDLTVWGLVVFASAKARQRAAIKARARDAAKRNRGAKRNQPQGELFEAA